jgi:signal transduction histidine kinase
LKHTPAVAAVSISVAQSPRPAITVLDNGEGIPADETQAIVEPFYRRDQSRTTAGAGLGLSIVKAIADLHDADLRLETLREGFRATITFHTKEKS